ncbi:hypothetical protein ACJIZ3_016645 [Penstemon smallii]|uniref:Uncharacterized protein n=1 Tax=Penstemon smallii TaxID=265156 RepID=A0ABD3STQ4_9LAMI
MEFPGAYVEAEIAPVALEERDCAEEGRGKYSSEAEDTTAVDESSEELAVHGLMPVIAEDGSVRAGEIIERVVGALLEVAALVVACKHRASWLYRKVRRSRSSAMDGTNLGSPADVPELQIEEESIFTI